MDEHGRRRFLKTASVGMTAAIAGCGSAEDAPAQSSTEDQVTVTVVLNPDRDALQMRRQELVEEVEAGNVTQSEAAEQFSEERSELLAETATNAQESLESGGAEIEDVDEEALVMRATGNPATLVSVLTEDYISAISEASDYDEFSETPEGGDANATDTGAVEDGAGE
ncbi:probable secreted glycoprotein [Natronomonas moolapensis 8.8.11]|uniref:Probable secreted glycoprotein n=1 Tax=Natronomonas moolapensis (strain DSM 18674 / CECT 7526 / JCM 14361 / 8.8.11) TaxID=268739 RepID=M1XTB6_NATM8|nr:hypothetical protein [Natronomonas moolapensis]CCQ37643.1 probable secreted glycoprotein [Natronomonas moolapensis 8.8.11]